MKPAGLVAYRAFSDVAAKAALFAVTILAARRLSRDGFGVFALGTTVGWLAAVASDFGMQLHLARSVARAPQSAVRLLRTWLSVRLASAALAFVGVFVALLAFGRTSAAPALLLLALVYLVGGLVEFLHYFYRGLSRSDIESTLTLWQRLGTLVCASAALWLRPDPAILAGAMLAPVVVTASYSLRRAQRLAAEARSSASDRGGSGEPRPAGRSDTRDSGPRSSEFLRDVAPIGAGILLSALYFRIDVFMLQAWQGTDAVALYNAVFRIVEALRLFPAAVLAVALPTLVRATSARPLVQMSAGLTGFGVAVALVLWASADHLIPLLYGSAYAGSAPAFKILLLSFPLMSLNYALTHQLIGWHGHRAYAGLCLAALVFNIALNARLIPAMSLNGAAWATVWTEASLSVGCVIALARRSGAAATAGRQVEGASVVLDQV